MSYIRSGQGLTKLHLMGLCDINMSIDNMGVVLMIRVWPSL